MLTFADALTVHFGGHEIEVRYFPGAHSDADVAVFMREINLLHTGDLYLSNGFPIIDSFHGGTIDGSIAAVDSLINLIDDDTKIVPGHGPISNRQELCEYRIMISAARDNIAALIKEGKSLEETVAAEPTAGLFGRGKSWLSPQLFVWTVYEDLVRSR
jgi:glyoxylase-like metal-dependent hydrolase (beta-lactamase superfamily II)